MLIPRYSLRAILTTVTLAAVYFVVVGFAFRGHGWAVVITVSVACVPVVLLFHAVLYSLCRAYARLLGTEDMPALTSQGAVRVASEGSQGADD